VVALKLRAVYRGENVFGCEAVRAKLQKERIHLIFIQLRSESLNCKENGPVLCVLLVSNSL
jgi:hypothetical protein